jgi:hypothetical protein
MTASLATTLFLRRVRNTGPPKGGLMDGPRSDTAKSCTLTIQIRPCQIENPLPVMVFALLRRGQYCTLRTKFGFALFRVYILGLDLDHMRSLGPFVEILLELVETCLVALGLAFNL